MKRTQIQIAIDAMKKQVAKYQESYQKNDDAEKEILKNKDFLSNEIVRLEAHIKQLES